jgi:hypothetical protein
MKIDKNDPEYLYVCTMCNISKKNSEYPKKVGDRRLRKYSSICKICNKDRWKKYIKSPIKLKTYKLKYFFNLSYSDWEFLKLKQSNSCAICKTPENNLDRSLAVDHNHLTGKVRGLLCNSCNLGLGKFKDNIEILENALKYMKENEE